MMEGLGPRAQDLDLVLKAMQSFGRGLSRLMRIAATCQALSRVFYLHRPMPPSQPGHRGEEAEQG